MIELHTFILEPEAYGDIVCNTIHVYGPFHYPSLVRIIKQVSVTGVILVDPLATQPALCLWAYQYASQLKGDCIGLPVTISTFAPEVDTITIA